ncbi:MAG: diadenylate cyclase CdaA [Bacillota bacterium]|nr:diadenylate cyclase CdaA [Bacillota bacterium]MDD3297700.1 diadenylate cyclase CdaA [Bacillota bacterium]MDD3850405.1 diadenylate cyclase CdaA [Bacillota bacterium]MDD4706600.1 diadenylate cyclase CdaA [Bacillota bacterium]
MATQMKEIIMSITLWDVIDIAVIAYVFYKIFMLIRETRAEQLIKGIFVLIFATWATGSSGFFRLYTVNWLLRNTMTVGVIALLIVFQPELRRALEFLGRGGIIFGNPLSEALDKETKTLIDEITVAVQALAKKKVGALIVLERETGVGEFMETGTTVDAVVSSRLLQTIFATNTPLHDGAVIIRDKRIASAGCLLPLTENQSLSKELGTRHRAGLGISEYSDAIAIIVSEETGVISTAKEGRLSRYLDGKMLKEMLVSQYKPQEHRYRGFLKWRVKDVQDDK